jgi:putative ABC transport system permease protein
MDAVSHRLSQESADDTGLRIHLLPLEEFVHDEYRTAAMTLQGVVIFVLLIACANVAGLLLAQGMSQQRELACASRLDSMPLSA